MNIKIKDIKLPDKIKVPVAIEDDIDNIIMKTLLGVGYFDKEGKWHD